MTRRPGAGPGPRCPWQSRHGVIARKFATVIKPEPPAGTTTQTLLEVTTEQLEIMIVIIDHDGMPVIRAAGGIRRRRRVRGCPGSREPGLGPGTRAQATSIR